MVVLLFVAVFLTIVPTHVINEVNARGLLLEGVEDHELGGAALLDLFQFFLPVLIENLLLDQVTVSVL